MITSTGFDENLPLREFEGYFGISSYRASIAASRNGPFDELCFTFLRASEKHPYASGKEVKIVGEWQGVMFLFFRHSVSKTKSRKAKSGGGLKKWPAVMDGGLDGTLRKRYCEDPSYYEIPNKAQNRKRVF